MKPHILIDLLDQNLSWEYMGFALNRKFHPCLTINGDLKYVFEGYHTVWNLLDTVCFKEPLPRSHFNDVLKHRWEGDDTSLDIIKEVVRGGDCTKIIVQGDIDESENMFIVRIVHKPWGGLKSPVLNEITDILLTEDASTPADALFWEPYTAILKSNGFANRTMNLASIVAVWRIYDGGLVLRVLLVEKTESFLFIPTLERDNEVYPHPLPIQRCSTTATHKELCEIVEDIHQTARATIPLINKYTPTFSGIENTNEATIPKYKRNARMMSEWIQRSF